jgi:hypothetical protein
VTVDLDAIEAISNADRYVHPDEVLGLVAEVRRLTEENQQLREAVRSSLDCCARASACGAILREAVS